MNEKLHYLDLLNNNKYDGVKGAREHILLLSLYFNKLKNLQMTMRDEYLHYFIINNFPS